jgi:hypothetical protein
MDPLMEAIMAKRIVAGVRMLPVLAIIAVILVPARALDAETMASFGFAADLGVLSPYAELGSIVPMCGAWTTSAWRLGAVGEESSFWLRSDIGIGLTEGVAADFGILLGRYPAKGAGTRGGLGLGLALRGDQEIYVRTWLYFDPLSFYNPKENSGGVYVSFLDLSLGAIIGPDPLLSGFAIKVSLIEFSGALDREKTIEDLVYAFAPREADLNDGSKPHFLLETSLSTLPIMFINVIPFTEWGFGLEWSKGAYSASVMARINAVMVFLDNYDSLRVELCPLRARIGAWRPAFLLGLKLSNFSFGYGGSKVGVSSFGDLVLDLACFDLRTRKDYDLRISILPLTTDWLPPQETHVLTYLRAGFRY